jgi:hypothetical protein
MGRNKRLCFSLSFSDTTIIVGKIVLMSERSDVAAQRAVSVVPGQQFSDPRKHIGHVGSVALLLVES